MTIAQRSKAQKKRIRPNKALKKLVDQYRKAKAEYSSKVQAAREAAGRALELGIRLQALPHLIIYQSVYSIGKNKKGGRPVVHRLARNQRIGGGRDPWDPRADWWGRATSGKGCKEACAQALADAGDDPNPPEDMYCVCDCQINAAGEPIAVVNCYHKPPDGDGGIIVEGTPTGGGGGNW